MEFLQKQKKDSGKKTVILKSPFPEISKRLWERLVSFSNIKATDNWADMSNHQLEKIWKDSMRLQRNLKSQRLFICLL